MDPFHCFNQQNQIVSNYFLSKLHTFKDQKTFKNENKGIYPKHWYNIVLMGCTDDFCATVIVVTSVETGAIIQNSDYFQSPVQVDMSCLAGVYPLHHISQL